MSLALITYSKGKKLIWNVIYVIVRFDGKKIYFVETFGNHVNIYANSILTEMSFRVLFWLNVISASTQNSAINQFHVKIKLKKKRFFGFS